MRARTNGHGDRAADAKVVSNKVSQQGGHDRTPENGATNTKERKIADSFRLTPSPGVSGATVLHWTQCARHRAGGDAVPHHCVQGRPAACEPASRTVFAAPALLAHAGAPDATNQKIIDSACSTNRYNSHVYLRALAGLGSPGLARNRLVQHGHTIGQISVHGLDQIALLSVAYSLLLAVVQFDSSERTHWVGCVNRIAAAVLPELLCVLGHTVRHKLLYEHILLGLVAHHATALLQLKLVVVLPQSGLHAFLVLNAGKARMNTAENNNITISIHP
jgi:hypothetical protein